MLLRLSYRPGGTWALLVVAWAVVSGCASEEIPRYGDPAQVAGGVGGAGGGTGVGGDTCEIDPSCGVSFANDVFPVLDGTSKCGAAMGCHADGKGNLVLNAGDAAGYHAALTAYDLDNPPDVGPYVVPCSPEKSTILCNLNVSGGDDNPHGSCGSGMPPNPANGPTLAQLQAIEEWIACGAPDN